MVVTVCKSFYQAAITCCPRISFIFQWYLGTAHVRSMHSMSNCSHTFNHISPVNEQKSRLIGTWSRSRSIVPVIVFKVVDTLAFDGLLQDLWLTAAELLTHLHQPGRDGWRMREQIITETTMKEEERRRRNETKGFVTGPVTCWSGKTWRTSGLFDGCLLNT